MSKTITTIKLFPEDQKRYFFSALHFPLTFFCLISCLGFPPRLILFSVQPQYVEDLESGFSSDVESKYKKIYEDDINPFAAFSKKVKKTFSYSALDSFLKFTFTYATLCVW